MEHIEFPVRHSLKQDNIAVIYIAKLIGIILPYFLKITLFYPTLHYRLNNIRNEIALYVSSNWLFEYLMEVYDY